MLLYRSAAWFAKGLREYTKSGYESASKDFVPDDLEVQVPGRAFMVTGGNSGIGKATAMEIAKRGGTVHLVCRDHSRAEGAKAEIIRESGNQNIFLHIVDLSLPKSVWKFVENFKQEHTLNVLINNAGCMVNKRELTEDGLEKNFATNTLGVYVLTTALIPVLEKEHDPRVITVSSGGMLVQKLNTDDPQSERTAFDGTMVYAQNKERESSSPSEAQLSSAWTRVEVRGFSSPRGGATKAATSLPEYLRPTRRVVRAGVRLSMPGFHARLGARLRSEAQGADTVLWLALAPAATAQPSGCFFQDRKPAPTHLPLARTSSSPAEEEKLIEILEELARRFK